MRKPQTGRHRDQTHAGGQAEQHSSACLPLGLDSGSLGQHLGDARRTLDDVRLERRMRGRPRSPCDFAENIQSGAVDPLRIRVGPKRQLLDAPHELSEVCVCDRVHWLKILHPTSPDALRAIPSRPLAHSRSDSPKRPRYALIQCIAIDAEAGSQPIPNVLARQICLGEREGFDDEIPGFLL